MNKLKLIGITLLAFFLTSCSSVTPLAVQPTSSGASLSTATLFFNSVATVYPPLSPPPVLTNTPLLTVTPTSTFTPSPTPESLPIRVAKQQCIPIRPELAPGFLSSGVLILGNFTNHVYVGDLVALTPQVSQPKFIPGAVSFGYGKVSPNGKLLAYANDGQLVIISADGKIHVSESWDSQWKGGFLEWLGQDRLQFNDWEPSDSTASRIILSSRIILNPFTKEIQRLNLLKICITTQIL